MITKSKFLEAVSQKCSPDDSAKTLAYARLWWMISSRNLPVILLRNARLINVERSKNTLKRYEPNDEFILSLSESDINITPISDTLKELGLYKQTWFYHDGNDEEWDSDDTLIDESELELYRTEIELLKKKHGELYKGGLYTRYELDRNVSVEKESYALPTSVHYDQAFEQFISPELKAKIELAAQKLAQEEELKK